MLKMLHVALVAVCFATAIGAQVALYHMRPVMSPALEESALATLGVFRTLAAEMVWFRAERLQEGGRYVELAQLAHVLTAAEPHTPEVWSYAAWNLAYNVSVMMPTAEDRWRWVAAAVELLRDKGLRLNPGSVELYRELAWLFELKMGDAIDSAAPSYRAYWRTKVADVARRDAWDEIGMDRSTMNEVERCYGMTDRLSPLYSAIYWAHVGLRYAEGHDRDLLLGIIRQSKLIYKKGMTLPR